jgi:tetratricopeptide (TPR) repeat protein
MKAELTSLYLTTWPSSQRATQLLLQQEEAGSNVSVEDLLGVFPSDPKYQQSQRKASRLLYSSWIESNEIDQKVIGNQYVSIASSLMLSDETLQDNTAIQRSVVRALRILEVALHSTIRRTVAAEQAFKVIDAITALKKYDLTEFTEELLFRKVMFFLYTNKIIHAFDTTSSMIESAPNSNWTRASANALWQQWEDGLYSTSTLDRFRIGSFLLSSCTDSQYANSTYMPIAISVAKSGLSSSQEFGIEENGQEALRTIHILLLSYPNSEQIVQLAAELESAIGNHQTAAEHWKKLVTSSKKESEQWLKAKYNIALSLSVDKSDTALEFLNQHKSLYPEYGIDPYGSLLRLLHEQLAESQ